MSKKRNQKNLKAEKLVPGFLTDREVELLQKQIRANSLLIDYFIEIIDLLANKERCPKDANTLLRFRKRLEIAMAESDTFRKVLWKHMQVVEQSVPQDGLDAASFLVDRIRSRKFAQLAQAAMK
jgi:hypothetical protein